VKKQSSEEGRIVVGSNEGRRSTWSRSKGQRGEGLAGKLRELSRSRRGPSGAEEEKKGGKPLFWSCPLQGRLDAEECQKGEYYYTLSRKGCLEARVEKKGGRS